MKAFKYNDGVNIKTIIDSEILEEALDKSGGTITGKLNVQGGLKIPTTEPENPEEGDIWIS